MKLAKPSFHLGLSLILFCAFIAGCAEKPPDKLPPPVMSPPPIILNGDNIVLARVNGSPITRYDLEQTIRSTLRDNSASQLDEAGRKKVLDSLVASRTIAQAQAQALSREEHAALDKKVEAYREQLLVKQYLGRHATLQPVTRDMVREYYESNPERFGGKTIRTYEMIVGKRTLKARERDALIQLLKNPSGKKDWKEWVATLQARGYPVAYCQGQVDEKILHPQLRRLTEGLKKGEASQLSFIKGISYIVRIVDEKQIPPRPLGEVSAEIRKSLAPVQVKKAVRQASEQVLETARVVYERGEEGRE